MGSVEENPNKRASERHKVYWNVFKNFEEEENEVILGFINNLSLTGVNMWIDKTLDLDDNFTIKIYPPEEIKIDTFKLSLKTIWNDSQSNKEYNIYGCQFIDISPEDQDTLEFLISEQKRLHPDWPTFDFLAVDLELS